MTMPMQYIGTDVPNARKFPQTPSKKEDKHPGTTTGQYSVLSTTSTTTVHNCQELTDEAMIRNRVELIREQYLHCIGREMPMSFMRQVLLDLIAGTPWQYYEYALEETAFAPNPSWRYTMAIVRRLVNTATPIDRIRDPKPAPKEKPLTEMHAYHQREYDPVQLQKERDAELDAMMAKFLAEQAAEEAANVQPQHE